MSFYFQPPIFAVQPATPIRPLIALPPSNVFPSYTTTTTTTTIQQPVPVYHPLPVLYVSPPTWSTVYHPTSISPKTALQTAMPPRLTPTLTIRMVFYGHGPLRNDSSGVRGTWCRATDARYTEGEVPGKERLMGDVSRFAGQHGLRAAGWRHARIFIMYGGSPGLIIASGVGPVVNETVVSVLDVHNTLPAPLGSGSGSGSRGGAAAVDVSQGELEAALRGAMRGNLVVYLAVCMDEEQVLPRDDGFLQQQLQQRAAIEDGTDDPRNRAPEPQPGPEPEPEEQEEEDDAMPERPADADAAPEDLLTEPQQQTAEATIEAEQVDPVSQ